MTIEALTADVLKAVEANRVKHMKVAKEARSNYLRKVRDGLEKALMKIKDGKTKVTDSVQITFTPPPDYTDVYDQAIVMLKLHSGKTITLKDDQIRTLVMDNWEWKRTFRAETSQYLGG